METAKKSFYPNRVPFFSLLVLLTLLLTACSNFASTGGAATPTPTPTHIDQHLVYTYEDSAHIWHLSRYNTRTGQKADIYTTEAGQIKEAQVSADGKQVLFLIELYPAMRADASAKVQVIRMDGQGLQTFYSVPLGRAVSGLKWSPDQRLIAFQEQLNVYLLDVASKTARLVVPAKGNQGFMPRTWLDTTRLYLAPFTGNEIPPLELYLLDSRTAKVQQVLSVATLAGDFDSSIDGTTLFTCQYAFNLPTASGPSSIETRPATGGQAIPIYKTPAYAITALRVASRTSLLFLIHNSGMGNIDTSHNGLWKINTDGTDLRRLTSEASDELTMFPTFTRYVWSSISRDGTLYAVKVVHTTSPNPPTSLLIGSMSGGTPTSIASTGTQSMLEIVGWTEM